MKKLIPILLIVLVLVGVYVVVQVVTGSKDDRPTVKMVYVEGWSTEVASTNVIKAVLETKFGYNCQITPVGAAAMWEAVATGGQDGMVAAWLPTTHDDYLEKHRDNVVDLGPNLEGTQIGLVVPKYVTIDTIPDLAVHADRFDGEIVGIGPGAGVMKKTEKALDEYKLREDYDLVASSGPMMASSLASHIEEDAWVVITGWRPHWTFEEYDLKFLHDPKNVYGGKERINTIVRKGLKEDMLQVYKFLDQFYWTPKQMNEVLVMNQKGGKPFENAKKWIEQNPETVAKWLEGIDLPKAETSE
jgi:glycine betaine/proline transport system substrate-binding protein